MIFFDECFVKQSFDVSDDWLFDVLVVVGWKRELGFLIVGSCDVLLSELVCDEFLGLVQDFLVFDLDWVWGLKFLNEWDEI